MNKVYNPGMLSNRGLTIPSSVGTIKQLVIGDMQKWTARGAFDVTTKGRENFKTLDSHSWLIAIRVGVETSTDSKGKKVVKSFDYHFMLRSYNDNVWTFKAGISGPVMQLRNKKPSKVSWDKYKKTYVWEKWRFVSKYAVDEKSKGYYNSDIIHLWIKD